MGYYYEPQYTALYLPRDGYAFYPGGSWGFQPDGSEDFSIALWFWPDNSNARLLNAGNILTLDLQDDRLVFWLKGYTDLVCMSNTYPLLRHEWNHVAITYSHLGQIFFYINGILIKVFSLYQDKPATQWKDIFFCEGMRGYLRSVQFFAQMLSDSEVDQVKRGIDGAPTPIRWFDFETASPVERVTRVPLELKENAKPYSLADGLFCDSGEGFYPLDGNTVNPAASVDGHYTVQAWISIYDTDQSFATIFMNGRHDLDCGMALYLEKGTDGYHLCAGRGAHTRQQNILRSSHTISTRAWHNVAVVYDGSAMSIYIDGLSEGEKTDLEPFTEILDFGLLRIGTDDLPGLSGNEGCFHGAFGNIAVWNKALSPEQLSHYAANWPSRGEDGLAADYVFTRYTCCNIANGLGVSMAGVDTSRICRNPIETDFLRPAVSEQPPLPAAIPTLWGKTAAELRQERAASMPDAQTIVRMALEGVKDGEGLMDSLLPAVGAHLECLNSGTQVHPFYLYEQVQEGIYRFYCVSDQIYPAGELALDGQDEFEAWFIRLVCTVIIDILSIYCSVPSEVAERLPAAFQNAVGKDQLSTFFSSIKTVSFKKLVSSVCSVLLSGGFLLNIINQLRSQGIWAVGANIASMAVSFLAKSTTAWGWVLVFIRVGFLVADLVSLYREMPKLLGAELLQLNFQMDGVFVPATHSPCSGKQNPPQWQAGQADETAPPVVCCLRRARSEVPLQVTAQFTVYKSGTYHISASADPTCCLGSIDATNVELRADKDGICTVPLSFTGTQLDNVPIGSDEITLNWKIDGGSKTVTLQTKLHVFFIYDTPKLPWGGSSGYSTPWRSLLNFACTWAKGVSDPSDTQWQTKIAASIINSLWTIQRLHTTTYAQYVSGTGFYLTRIITDIAKSSYDVSVNDNDCAALLVAVCNLLGCDFRSVLLCGASGKILETQSLYEIGSETAQTYRLGEHEAVRTLRGNTPFYFDPYYRESKTRASPLLCPFHTVNRETGLCEMLFENSGSCVVSNNQQPVGNGIRTIF